MTKLGELLGTMADKFAQDSLNIGDYIFGAQLVYQLLKDYCGQEK